MKVEAGKRTHSVLAVALAGLVFGAPACGRSTRESAESQVTTRVRSAFGFSMPCSLAWCELVPDGGSIGGVLAGARGDSLLWAWGPGSTPTPLPPEAIRSDGRAMTAWSDSVLQSFRRRAFIGATRFSDASATPLGIGSSEESLFVQTLWSAVMRDSVSMKVHGPQGKGLQAAYVVRMLEAQRARVGNEPPPTRDQAQSGH